MLWMVNLYGNDTSVLMYGYASSIKQMSNIPLDIHLMVEDTKDYIDQYIALSPHFITIHYEVFNDKKQLKETIEYIKQNGTQCGLAIKPDTKVEEIYEFLPYISLLLVMTVEPGKGGQELLPETIRKIEKLSSYREEHNLDFDIEADGGINVENAQEIIDAGADILVAGTAILNSNDYAETIKKLR